MVPLFVVGLICATASARESRAAVRDDRIGLDACKSQCGYGTICDRVGSCMLAPCYISECCDIQDGPGCAQLTNEAYAKCVGDIDPFCESDEWDQQCIEKAKAHCWLLCHEVKPTNSPTESPTFAPTSTPTTTAPTTDRPTIAPTVSKCPEDTLWGSAAVSNAGCDDYALSNCDGKDDIDCNYCYCNGGFPFNNDPADDGPDAFGNTITAGDACPNACGNCYQDRIDCVAPTSFRTSKRASSGDPGADNGRSGRGTRQRDNGR